MRICLLLCSSLLGGLLACSLQAAETLPDAPPGSVSFVIIPDTQAYHGQGTKAAKADPQNQEPLTNEIFAAHMNWIVNNLEKQSIVFVSHVGDIVDINRLDQWKLAQQMMDKIHGKVPYGISVGNHDMTSKGDSTLFQQHFPKSRFENFPWYGGAFAGQADHPEVSGNNANSYQLFSAGGHDFLFLHLECNAPDDVVDWANEVLKAHPDRLAFITSHMGWGPLEHPKKTADFSDAPKGRMQWSKIHGKRGNTPQQLWEKCYSHQPHLVAVFSGDQSRTQAMHAATPGEHGNLIQEILQDYSTGWLRLVRFNPAEKTFEVFTFDPNDEQLCQGTKKVPGRDQHQFQFALPTRPAPVATAPQ